MTLRYLIALFALGYPVAATYRVFILSVTNVPKAVTNRGICDVRHKARNVFRALRSRSKRKGMLLPGKAERNPGAGFHHHVAYGLQVND